MLPATNLAAVCVDLVDMEMPELLRLSLGAGVQHGRADVGDASSLGRWTVFATCHWDEENGNHYYFSDARKCSTNIQGTSGSGYARVLSINPIISHWPTCSERLSPMLRDCHTWYRSSLQKVTSRGSSMKVARERI